MYTQKYYEIADALNKPTEIAYNAIFYIKTAFVRLLIFKKSKIKLTEAHLILYLQVIFIKMGFYFYIQRKLLTQNVMILLKRGDEKFHYSLLNVFDFPNHCSRGRVIK